jgi:hypothetical protein
MRRWRRRLLIALAALLALAGTTYGGLVAATARSQLARAMLWRESDVDDHRRFPARRIAAGPDRFGFQRPAAGSQVPPAAVRRISVWEGTRQLQRDLERFLAASQTTAFLIARGDTLLYEGYFNGYHRESTQTSMSVAKSVLGALVGIAVAKGRIGSVDDPITRYVPELADRDRRFDKVTLRHLLTMTSGLRYEEGGGPWSDDRHPPAVFARGKYGQHLYVVPDSDLVLVRFGRDLGYRHWPELLSDLASRLEASSPQANRHDR